MKIAFVGGKFIAEAETMQDVETLQGLATRKHKPHKKHQFIKRCDWCGRACKGLRGLSVHRAACYKNQPSIADMPPV